MLCVSPISTADATPAAAAAATTTTTSTTPATNTNNDRRSTKNTACQNMANIAGTCNNTSHKQHGKPKFEIGAHTSEVHSSWKKGGA